MRIQAYIFGSICIIAVSFFLTLAFLDSHGGSISLAAASLNDSLRDVLSPGPKILKSDGLDLQSMSRSTGSISDAVASASAPTDRAGVLLHAKQLKLPTGFYRVEITFSCKQNESTNVFEINGTDPTHRITRFELGPQAPACDGSVKDVALGFRVPKAPESIDIDIQYGGSGTLQVRKVVLNTLSHAAGY